MIIALLVLILLAIVYPELVKILLMIVSGIIQWGIIAIIGFIAWTAIVN